MPRRDEDKKSNESSSPITPTLDGAAETGGAGGGHHAAATVDATAAATVAETETAAAVDATAAAAAATAVERLLRLNGDALSAGGGSYDGGDAASLTDSRFNPHAYQIGGGAAAGADHRADHDDDGGSVWTLGNGRNDSDLRTVPLSDDGDADADAEKPTVITTPPLSHSLCFSLGVACATTVVIGALVLGLWSGFNHDDL